RSRCEDIPVRRDNILAPEFDHSSEREGYRWRGARVGRAVGSEEIGVAGSPTLRTRAGERALREGDVVCFSGGPDGAHQVTGPGTVLILSDNRTPVTAEYPDSGKITVSGKTFRLADAVDVWDGE